MEVKPAVYLADVATIRVVEGPVMIKSENGLLRSYVQLNVRDRDIIGFVEEAQRAVAAKVKMPSGTLPGMDRPVRAPGSREENLAHRVSDRPAA